MEERIFTGPIDEQLRNALNYIENWATQETHQKHLEIA